ncbi:MAG: peptidylprolyl isomerase [Deltaproteobacteria bacterium]|nr:peptidylprolyl isomerase [Deltaproteobacteria bacterium]
MRVILWALIVSFAAIELFSPSAPIAAQSTKDDKVVKDGAVISLQYTLSGEDGKTIESNKGKEVLKYTQGKRQIVPGLEKGLAGMKVGEEKRVKVKPEEGYGPVSEKARQEFPKEKIPPESLKVGATLVARGPDGQAVPVRVHQIKEKTVVIDMNHPMAGKTLVFDVKILDIQSAEAAPPAKPAQPAASPQPAKPNPPK